MRNKFAFFGFLIICVILSSCKRQGEQPSVFSTNTPAPSAMVAPTQTLIRPTETPKLALTPTVTLIPPYLTKQPLLDYFYIGGLSDFNFYLANSTDELTKLVLYSDGQIIILRGDTYQQKILSIDEMNQFFSKLEALGFYTIQSNQEHDETDQLYNFGGKFSEVGVTDSPQFCILVTRDQSRDLCVSELYLDYITPQMRSILDFLNNYEPHGLTPYVPERILLRIEEGRNEDDDNLTQNSIPWTESSFSIDLNCGKKICTKIVYVEGEKAKELFMLYGDKGHVFTQNGKEYTVYIRAVLPHEEITNIHDQ